MSVWLRTYEAIFYGTIDNRVPVSMSNVPDRDLRMREQFEIFMLEGVGVFTGETTFIKLPHSSSQRIATVLAAL